jgi:hypothetical protein
MENQGKKSIWSIKAGILTMLLAPLLAISPLVGIPLARVFCGPDANESNCGFGVLPWFMYFTIPAGALLFIVGLVVFTVALVMAAVKKTN